jgi:hypothetical protein
LAIAPAASSATSVLNIFCTDLTQHEYAGAYDLLSSRIQAEIAESEFAHQFALHEVVDGPIRYCGTPSSGYSFEQTGDTASLAAQITRNHVYLGVIGLVQEHGVWKVDALDPALLGTDIGPLLIADRFLKLLVSQDYAAAYNLLSLRVKHASSQDDLMRLVTVTLATRALGGGSGGMVTIYTLGPYTPPDANGGAAVQASLTFTAQATGSTGVLGVTLTLVQDGADSRIDDIS